MRAAGEPLHEIPRFGDIPRLAKNQPVKHDDRVGGKNGSPGKRFAANPCKCLRGLDARGADDIVLGSLAVPLDFIPLVGRELRSAGRKKPDVGNAHLLENLFAAGAFAGKIKRGHAALLRPDQALW